MNCPQGYNEPYSEKYFGREGCVECTIKECLIPSVNHEIGEWYPYWLDELTSLKSEFIARANDLKLDYFHTIGVKVREGLEQCKKKYGEQLMQDSADRLGIGLTTLYYCKNFAEMYPKIDDCPAVSWSKAKKLIDAKGDVKVLSQECEHPNKIQVWWCTKCRKKI